MLALDVGGTKVAAALVEPGGRVRARRTVPTPRSISGDEVFGAVALVLGALLAEAGRAGVRGVGIGSAGPVDLVAGTVSPVNIVAWRGFPLRDRVADLVGGGPVRLAGDGICATLGEHWRGAGEQVSAMLGVVVSTGVGGGLILAGRPYLGPTSNAGHVGHVVVDLDGAPCHCGGRGCVETLASGPSLVRAALAGGWSPNGRAGPGEPTARDLAASARAGDPIARRAFVRGGAALAAGFVGVAALCDVDRVVVGGGVAQAGPLLFDAIAASLTEYAGLDFVRRVSVHPARLGPTAGLVGAASLLLRPEVQSGVATASAAAGAPPAR